MKSIPLSNNQKSLVSDGDFDRVNHGKWSFDGQYAHRTIGKEKKKIYMHRFILDAPPGSYTDHINGNKLDNRRENLRICNNSQNMSNRGLQKNNTSGYKGVSWNKGRKSWECRIKIQGRYIKLGFFLDKEEAAKAYNEAALKYHGEFAKLNEILT